MNRLTRLATVSLALVTATGVVWVAVPMIPPPAVRGEPIVATY